MSDPRRKKWEQEQEREREMSKHTKRAAKRDDNEKEIIQALRAAGAFVQALSEIDLLVGHRGAWHLIEVKDGNKSPSRRKLTFDEMQFVLDIKNRAPVHVVVNVEQALDVIQPRAGQ